MGVHKQFRTENRLKNKSSRDDLIFQAVTELLILMSQWDMMTERNKNIVENLNEY